MTPGGEQPRSDVALHEFAHKIDMADGTVDGVPSIATREGEVRRLLRAEHTRAVAGDRFLDSYAAISEAELFAVATEMFVCRLLEVRGKRPELYRAMVTSTARTPPPAAHSRGSTAPNLGEAMAIRHDTGIVLRSYPFGEADRVVVLLSPHHGKLRTVAKGVRKTTSRFGGRLEPFGHVELVLYEGRNLDTVTQVEVVEAFPRLRAELERVTAASTMVEAIDAVAQEREPSVALFNLLSQGLRVLDGAGAHRDLVSSFLLHLAGVVGVAPALERCAACGRADGLDRFSFESGGVMCNTCRGEGAVRLRSGVVAHLATLAGADLGTATDGDPALASEAMGITRRFVEHHLDRRLSSLAVLDG
jgi:DNA repair protein RecO (recombination protein O)